jgi:hypothetical protein
MDIALGSTADVNGSASERITSLAFLSIWGLLSLFDTEGVYWKHKGNYVPLLGDLCMLLLSR